jgi:hypothetical protein
LISRQDGFDGGCKNRSLVAGFFMGGI